MNNENSDVQAVVMSEKEKRAHDQAPSAAYAQFMSQGWAPSGLTNLSPLAVVPFAAQRRSELSAAFTGLRLVLPAGPFKVRSNDTDYFYRPHSAFVYYSGVQGSDSTADAVLVMEPNGDGHDTYLYMHPRSTRDSDSFYRDARYGELWIGRRFTLDEASAVYQIEARHLNTLSELLKDKRPTVTIRHEDVSVDSQIALHERDLEFKTFTSEHRLCKDSYEVNEMQKAVDATGLGFSDMISALPAAVNTPRGERILEGAFYGRARLAGNDLGYNTIVGSGTHATTLHWTRNDGNVRPGDLVLIDAGIEIDSFYTADITRTLPVNGKFSPIQRSLYMLVFEAQRAAMNAIKPGVKFKDINATAQAILAKGLADMGVLPVSAEDALLPENGHHRRWTLHGTSHHLGLDVHDCAHARKENYLEAELKEGMIITVEPGLYIQADDLLFAPEYRGIGIRIEDDVLVTATGFRNLSQSIPAHPDEIEAWMKNILG